MTMSDPIADFLTRIRNANMVKHDTVDAPASKIKQNIADILQKEGYIKSYSVSETENNQGNITVTLKYGPERQRVISGLKRVSKPGLRTYAGSEDIPKVLNGMGIAIISTSKGLITDKEARAQHIGGEVIAYIW